MRHLHLVRLMLASGIVAEEDTKVVHMIEEDFGAKIVVEDNCRGERREKACTCIPA